MSDELDAIEELGAAAAAELAASALASRGKAATQCANCGAALIGPYCAACGQKRDTLRHTVWKLFEEGIDHLVRLDSKLLRTLRALLVEPGELPRAFKAGQTQRYVPAIRLYLFTSLIFFVLLSISGIALMQLEVHIEADGLTITRGAHGTGLIIDTSAPATRENPAIAGEDDPDPDPDPNPDLADAGFSARLHFFAPVGSVQNHISEAARADIEKARAQFTAGDEELKGWLSRGLFDGLDHIAQDPAAINAPLTAWIPRVLFLLLPLFALLLALFYWRQRKGFFFVDHLIFSLNVHTFAFVLLIVAAGAAQIVPGESIAWLVFGVQAVYLLFAMKEFYAQSWLWTGIKFAGVSLVYGFLCLIPALLIVVTLSVIEA